MCLVEDARDDVDGDTDALPVVLVVEDVEPNTDPGARTPILPTIPSSVRVCTTRPVGWWITSRRASSPRAPRASPMSEGRPGLRRPERDDGRALAAACEPVGAGKDLGAGLRRSNPRVGRGPDPRRCLLSPLQSTVRTHESRHRFVSEGFEVKLAQPGGLLEESSVDLASSRDLPGRPHPPRTSLHARPGLPFPRRATVPCPTLQDRAHVLGDLIEPCEPRRHLRQRGGRRAIRAPRSDASGR